MMNNYQPKLRALTGEQLVELCVNMDRSVADFLDFCFIYGGKEALEVAEYYIRDMEQLSEFVSEYFSGNYDSIYDDLSVYARTTEMDSFSEYRMTM